ncbi:hypothetical protein MKJ01_12185 [Chryseobacterium sp. SSA4.19]|uniref:hypothetical protein n=1 Tax=Chryseobacterium sp. SSA4.19 TaxID=2919915 RepID=UPI001F4DB5C2|nr:hypothetical protein [Chryseobacterium sp. SSA4.19]MCJ8154523.1 hypothetical protein [Chryseobacterium sp. SSA4.19]
MKAKWMCCFFIVLTVVTLLSFRNYKNRIFDWDMPGYIGCLYTLKYPNDPDKVRTLTYAEIEKEGPELQYKDILGILTPPDKARQAFAGNTRAFSEQLPYFQIKAGYNLAILLLYEFGFSPPKSVLLLSIISYFISGLLFFYISKIIFPGNYFLAGIITIGLMLLPPINYMARIATPDMFIFQFLLVFMIGLLRKWNQWIMFLILFVITFTRPDYIPFTLSYLGVKGIYEYYQSRKLSLNVIIQGIVLVTIYMVIMKICHYPGWKHLFYDSFIYRRHFISVQPPDFTLKEYFEILLGKVIYFKRITFISVSLLGLTFYCSKDRWIRICSMLIFVNIYIKFLFFPHASGLRFFFGLIIMLFIVFLWAASRKYNGFKLRKIA